MKELKKTSSNFKKSMLYYTVLWTGMKCSACQKVKEEIF